MRVHSNIGMTPTRILKKLYNAGGTAAGTTNAIATTLITGTLQDALGVSGFNGVVSFITLDGGTQNFTIYEWNKAYANINSGNGWVLSGATVTDYRASVEVGAKANFLLTENTPYAIVAATTAVAGVVVSGHDCASNKNTDLTYGDTH